MQAVRVRCSRCGWDVDGLYDEHATAGYYRVNVGPWEKYGRPGETYLCDACMRSDLDYCHDYRTSPIEGHMMVLQRRWPQAHSLPLEDHLLAARLIVVPDLLLPPGWNRKRTTVRFKWMDSCMSTPPSEFWCDVDLRLASGGMPTWTNLIPGPDGERGLWFLHPLRAWHPMRDTLVTYFRTIRLRLQKAR